MQRNMRRRRGSRFVFACKRPPRSEEHTSEPSHLGISYAVFCLKKKSVTAKMDTSAYGSHMGFEILYRPRENVFSIEEEIVWGVGEDLTGTFVRGPRRHHRSHIEC